MKAIIRVGYLVLAFALTPSELVVAQSVPAGCSSENSTNATQTLRCDGGVVIVAEDGARYILHRGGSRRVDSAELSTKALLLEVPEKPGGNRFRVKTPQAIAAVRGTKWAVDVVENKTSVFVVHGQVIVGRRGKNSSVTLGPGEGVDVEAAAADPLTVKLWPPARVSALMARLGQ